MRKWLNRSSTALCHKKMWHVSDDAEIDGADFEWIVRRVCRSVLKNFRDGKPSIGRILSERVTKYGELTDQIFPTSARLVLNAKEDWELSIDLHWDRQTLDGRWYTGLLSHYRGCTCENGHTGVGIGTAVRAVSFCLLVQYVSRR